MAVDLDGAFMSPNDAKHGGKPEAAARELGSEEWIENARYCRRVYPVARVVDLQQNVPAWINIVAGHVVAQVFGVQVLKTGRDSHGPAFCTDGFRAIDHQVHHHGLELPGVGFDERALVEIEDQIDIASHRRIQKRGYL